MKYDRIKLILALFACLLALTACTEKHATKEQIIEHAENVADGEEVELMEETEENVYTFSSKERVLTFEVRSVASTLNIDGSNFGYTGDFYIIDNYADRVALYYEDEVLSLMEQYGFTDVRKSEQYNAPKHFLFCISRDYTSADLDRINAFLKGLQTITEAEMAYHSGEDFSLYTYEVVWQVGEAEYIRTSSLAGTDYTSVLYADGSTIDIRDLPQTNMRIANVIPPVRDGMLIIQ